MLNIHELQQGDRIETFVANGGVNLGEAKNGSSYIRAVVKLQGNDIPLMMFDASKEIYDDLVQEPVWYVEGKINFYQSKMQIQAESIRKAVDGEYDKEDFLFIEHGYYDAIVDDLKNMINSVTDMDLNILGNDLISRFETEFDKYPAAIGHHHHGLGGMAVHVKQVLDISLGMFDSMKSLMPQEVYDKDREYVIVGAILHDIGKFEEYTRNCFGYFDGFSDKGALFGHLFIGAREILNTAESLNLDMSKINRIAHIAASHHSKYEYHAISLPSDIPAAVVAMADQASATLHPFILNYLKQEDVVSADRTPFGGRYVKY